MADGGAVAAIDCGTNSTRLLIVDEAGQPVERHMHITRLGEGVDATHMLSADAMARTIGVLTDYRVLMDRHHVVRARLAASSAARDAGNAQDFFSAAEAVTGVTPELLSGEEEGRLSFAGATAHLGAALMGAGPLLVVDIGGGSTELSAGVVTAHLDAGGPTPVEQTEVSSISLDIGCVRISERFLQHDPARMSELADARTAIDEALDRARAHLPALQRGGGLVGLAGTVSTLAQLTQGRATYDRDHVHHAVLSRSDVDGWLERLGAEDSHARLKRPGMVAGRADVIVGGVLILAAVMEAFDRPSCVVSEEDILDGLVASVR